MKWNNANQYEEWHWYSHRTTRIDVICFVGDSLSLSPKQHNFIYLYFTPNRTRLVLRRKTKYFNSGLRSKSAKRKSQFNRSQIVKILQTFCSFVSDFSQDLSLGNELRWEEGSKILIDTINGFFFCLFFSLLPHASPTARHRKVKEFSILAHKQTILMILFFTFFILSLLVFASHLRSNNFSLLIELWEILAWIFWILFYNLPASHVHH